LNPGDDIATIISGNAALVSATKNLVAYGDVDGGTPVLKGLTPASVTVGSTWVGMSDGGIDDNHVVVSATYTFDPLFPALSALGYSMLPDFTATAIERALKI